MSGAHTPGPWVVNPIQLDQVATANATQVIARAALLGGAAVTIANARLIAAAPDLLEALESVVRTSGRMPITSDPYFAAAMHRAEVLVSKITGVAS